MLAGQKERERERDLGSREIGKPMHRTLKTKKKVCNFVIVHMINQSMIILTTPPTIVFLIQTLHDLFDDTMALGI